MEQTVKPYFKNLDALRFFAAAALMLHALTLKIDGTVDVSWMNSVRLFAKNGSLCVNLLHVMSGFLISFLLFHEEKNTGGFNIFKYYLRRTLRIWPLYLLIITSSFFLIPILFKIFGNEFHETANPYSFYFFWSNFSILKIGFPYSPILAVLWTVSVEEQFYICWPWLMKLFKRNRALLFSFIIIISIAFRIYFRNDGVTLFFNSFCIMSDFAIGAWLAMLANGENKLFDQLKKIPRQLIIFCYAVIVLCIIFYHPIFNSTIATIFERLILGVGFGFIILDQVFCEKRIFNLSQIPGAQWLGKRAYGFYCFHQVGILVSIKILVAVGFISQPFQYVFIMPVLAFLIAIVLAAISYRFFEKYFLDLKRKYES